MNKGQILCIIAACIVLVATFAFYWFSYIFGDVVYYTNGIGFIKKYMELWAVRNYTNPLGLPYLIFYSILVLFTLLICSPILLLIGIKFRAPAIIGSIMPTLVGAFIILYAFLGFGGTFINWLSLFGDSEPLIEGLFPISLGIEDHFELFGAYALLLGGIIGLIGGIKGPEKM